VITTEIIDDVLRVGFGRESSQEIARAWRDGLLALWCRTVGAAPGDARRSVFEPANDYEWAWHEVWVVPGGASLAFDGEGVMSGHGCHGETLAARATGLPPGVAFAAHWHIDHRTGGSLQLRLRGADGLAAFEAELRAGGMPRT